MRVGIGYDSHKFSGKGPVRLGGVSIPSRRGLAGHSDSDVLLHAITDALLGAIGEPDIGEQFPPNDPKYRNVDSRLFIEHAQLQIKRAGYRVGNIDATVIANAPKLSAYKQKMQRKISELLEISNKQVSVKAKTAEGMASPLVGMAVHVVVLLKPKPRKKSLSRKKVIKRKKILGRDSR